eukprot:CAMPEP_0171653422 /NCGR_PEP_ID=MMETSP0990-20121206/39541_1 /TAXON_ID=483369 /ORGANISM="non described non described, Strain CCMP2098" /LENGTH=45 /DNA_ID= /DNA_START= /DNA_END= /DNA_ORIENTATION=
MSSATPGDSSKGCAERQDAIDDLEGLIILKRASSASSNFTEPPIA